MNRTRWLIKMLVALALMIAMALVIVLPTTAHAQELPHCTTDPTEPCGLSASGYDLILDGTELKGIGQALEDGETDTGVNGLFVLAIIAHESGWGSSRLVREENNLGGITGGNGYRSFESRDECIAYMFDLLDRHYISAGRTTIEEISKVYCDPPGHWEESVTEIMQELIRDAGDTRD